MRTEIWKGYSASQGHYVQGKRAFDDRGVCYIVKGNKPIEDTPLYNIYEVNLHSVTRVIKRSK